MSRYQLSQPDQPTAKRLLFAAVDFFASLKLAVVLITCSAIGLGWATFVESEYGTPAVRFGVYGSPLFSLLMFFLAVNIFSAAAVRFPWQRHQTGFVITHIGLLILLFGCLVTRQSWIDAQMPIFEDGYGYRAFTDNQQFELTIRSPEKPGEEDVVLVPFVGGPFNWQDYETLFRMVGSDAAEAEKYDWLENFMDGVSMTAKNSLRATSSVAFSIAHRDQGVIYEDKEQGIKLELLDYLSNSRQQVNRAAPLTVKMKMSVPSRTELDEDGKPVELEPDWMPLDLATRRMFPDFYPHGAGGGSRAGGGRVSYREAGSPAETAAFLASRPTGTLDEAGQVVLYADGKSHHLNIKDLEAEESKRTPLGESGLSVAVSRRESNGSLRTVDQKTLQLGPTGSSDPLPGGAAVQLDIFRGDDSLGQLVLFADRPEYNIQRHKPGSEIYGTYWVDQSKKSQEEVMAGQGGSRIDVLMGDDKESLYYRYWNRREVAELASLPIDGTKVNAFKMPIAQLQMFVEEIAPPTETTVEQQALPFNKKLALTQKTPAAQVRLTVGEGEDALVKEFWLTGMPVEPFERDPGLGEIESLLTPQRQVSITMQPVDSFTDVNFQVRLDKFNRKLDPGTDQAAHYGSIIDIVGRDLEAEPSSDGDKLARKEQIHEDVEILMNVPFDAVDPETGRTYRLFQESFGGPWKPGEQIYQEHSDVASGREHFYMSVLTVNYDPGRAAKYLGCALVCLGIFTMFYMRAYFFKRPTKPSDNKRAPAGNSPVVADAVDGSGSHNEESSRTPAPTG